MVCKGNLDFIRLADQQIPFSGQKRVANIVSIFWEKDQKQVK